MQPVFAVGYSVFSPLGINVDAAYDNILLQKTAVKQYHDESITDAPFYASRLAVDQMQWLQSKYGHEKQLLSPFEQMCICAMEQAVEQTSIDITSSDCIVILSSTKGNIEWITQQPDNRISLTTSAKKIAQYFHLSSLPLIVSNACISGVTALSLAKRLLDSGQYKSAVVIGCDRFSKFVFRGFQSFHALANDVCQPFDKDRNGINLGEAAACIILSKNVDTALSQPLAILSGAGASNDANHLSGPSRTGEELAFAIDKAVANASITAGEIGMISAHGTATSFNDEMESKALFLSQTNTHPLHSLKCYIGHTLGAAGIVESIIACMAMQRNVLLGSFSFKELGVPHLINITPENRVGETKFLLKTASGFGGCNAALVWRNAN